MLPRRTLPILTILGLIAFFFVLLNGAFYLTERIWPYWLPHARPGTGYESKLELQVLTAEKQLRGEVVDPEIPLVVIVGQSSVRSGILIAMLKELDGIDCHYLVLGGAGKGLAPLLRTLEPLRRSSLRPSLVLLGFHNFYLAEGSPTLTVLPGKGPEPRDPDLRERILGFPESVLRISARRPDLAMEIDWFSADLRTRLATAFGLSLGGRELGEVDPWAEPHWRWDRTDPFSADAIAKTATTMAFGAEAYMRNPVAIRELTEAVRWLRAKGALVGIMNMPQHSSLRELTPPEALVALSGPIEKAFPGPEVRVIDLRDTLPDEFFLDPVHYSTDGRDRISSQLAPQIGAFLRENGKIPN